MGLRSDPAMTGRTHRALVFQNVLVRKLPAGTCRG
jgi:hypothetical protein